MITNRYSYIDLLRFIAAFTVAISHLFINKAGINVNLEIISSMAVEVFFIISGFVLAPQIIKLTEKKNFKEYRIFIIRRWYRTIPLYVLSLVLTSIILNKGYNRENLIKILKLQNIDTRPCFPSISTYPIWKNQLTKKQSNLLKNSKVISKQGINLPSGVMLREHDIKKVCDIINSF